MTSMLLCGMQALECSGSLQRQRLDRLAVWMAVCAGFPGQQDVVAAGDARCADACACHGGGGAPTYTGRLPSAAHSRLAGTESAPTTCPAQYESHACVLPCAGLALMSVSYVVHLKLLTQVVIKRHGALYARWREFCGLPALVHINLVMVNVGEIPVDLDDDDGLRTAIRLHSPFTRSDSHTCLAAIWVISRKRALEETRSSSALLLLCLLSLHSIVSLMLVTYARAACLQASLNLTVAALSIVSMSC